MSAPESVVRAMREEMDAHHPAPCLPHWNRCCCACGRHDMSGRDAIAHHEQVTADAAYAASLEWAAEELAPAWPNPVVPPADRLRRWARDPEPTTKEN